MLITPPRPLVVDPVCSEMEPELPTLDGPVLNTTLPDSPDDDTLADPITTDPEAPLRLEPLVIVTTPPTPPVAHVLEPADSRIAPDRIPLFVLPTTMLMAPPMPLDAAPDCREM